MKQFLVLAIMLITIPVYAAQTITVNGTQINLCPSNNGLTYCTKADEANSIMVLLNYKQPAEYKEAKLQKFNNNVTSGVNTVNTVGDGVRVIGSYFGHASF